MKYILLYGCFIFCFAKANAQQFKNNVGSPYISLSAYSKTNTDAFGTYSNTAALGNAKNAAIGLYAERRYGLQELNNINAIVAIPVQAGAFAVTANRYGFEGFSETQLGLGYGRALSEKISVGGKINYYTQQIPSYGTASTLNIEAGMLLHLTPKLNAGISTYNPTGGKFGANKAEQLQSIYKFGLGYDVSNKVNIATEIVKTENEPISLIGAVHYQFEKKFFAKVGLSTLASNFFVAAGIAVNNQFRLDVSIAHHQQLGLTPGVVLLYNFAKKESKK